MAHLIDTAVRPPERVEGGFATARQELPCLERCGYTSIQHAHGLYDGPPYHADDQVLVRLEILRAPGHASVRCGEYRYVLRHPERA